jgi:divalent metal cation (Fe/Co/Zn/Cd) transporter
LLIYLPFVLGHGKFESLGALGISSMLLVTSGGIAWHAFEVLQVYYFSLSKFVRAELYV